MPVEQVEVRSGQVLLGALGEKPRWVHGFSTRRGGVSQGVWRGLNLGHGLGDEAGHVETNRQMLQTALGVADWPLATVQQVHGKQVVRVDGPPDSPGGLPLKADALVTAQPGLLIGVRTADCVPILIAGPGAVAAVHAGWRGTALAIVREAVQALEALGQAPEQLKAVIGPCIQAAHYPVGQEVVEGLRACLGGVPGGLERVLLPVRPEDLRPDLPPPVARADLSEANRLLLRASGLPETQIEVIADCVCCDSQRYFSYRRDSGATGRMLSVIGLMPQALL